MKREGLQARAPGKRSNSPRAGTLRQLCRRERSDTTLVGGRQRQRHGPQDGGRAAQGHPHRLDLRAQDLPARLCEGGALSAEARYSAPGLQGTAESAGRRGVQLRVNVVDDRTVLYQLNTMLL